eukprot:1146762-Pelagomonas_calceolata.AAC.2
MQVKEGGSSQPPQTLAMSRRSSESLLLKLWLKLNKQQAASAHTRKYEQRQSRHEKSAARTPTS